MQPNSINVTSALLVKLPAFGGSRNERRRLRAPRLSTFSKLNWSGSGVKITPEEFKKTESLLPGGSQVCFYQKKIKEKQ